MSPSNGTKHGSRVDTVQNHLLKSVDAVSPYFQHLETDHSIPFPKREVRDKSQTPQISIDLLEAIPPHLEVSGRLEVRFISALPTTPTVGFSDFLIPLLCGLTIEILTISDCIAPCSMNDAIAMIGWRVNGV